MCGFFSLKSTTQSTARLTNADADRTEARRFFHSIKNRYPYERWLQFAVMGYGAYEGFNLADGGYVRSGLYSMAGCVVGFVVSYALVIMPLIDKCKLREQQCQVHKEHISDLMEALRSLEPGNKNLSLLESSLMTAVHEAMVLPSTTREMNAWNKQLHIMRKMEAKLMDDIERLADNFSQKNLFTLITYWSQPSTDLHQSLIDFQCPASLGLGL